MKDRNLAIGNLFQLAEFYIGDIEKKYENLWLWNKASLKAIFRSSAIIIAACTLDTVALKSERVLFPNHWHRLV